MFTSGKQPSTHTDEEGEDKWLDWKQENMVKFLELHSLKYKFICMNVELNISWWFNSPVQI